MSTAELTPLFPSALHPAIPIASQILSTLRNLTAPGKGNDIRSEERAALVGVAALLGCESAPWTALSSSDVTYVHLLICCLAGPSPSSTSVSAVPVLVRSTNPRVQSKDLLESSAQKACSVSPAHFRSALAHSRRLLKSVDTVVDTSPQRRPTRSSPTSGAPPDAEGSTSVSSTDPASAPFNTPRKRYKYSSGVDVSSLVRNTPKSVRGQGLHEPNIASPLRHSVTPSKRGQDGETEEDDARTPTKRVKFGTRAGVDLERAEVHVPEVLSSLRKRREDDGAFLALRPGTGAGWRDEMSGAGAADTAGAGGERKGIPVEDGLPDIRPMLRKQRREGAKERKREKKDWRFREQVWGSRSEENRAVLEKIFAALSAFLEANGIVKGNAAGTLDDALLGRTPVDPSPTP